MLKTVFGRRSARPSVDEFGSRMLSRENWQLLHIINNTLNKWKINKKILGRPLAEKEGGMKHHEKTAGNSIAIHQSQNIHDEPNLQHFWHSACNFSVSIKNKNVNKPS